MKVTERQVQNEAKDAANQHDEWLSLLQRQSRKAARASVSPKKQSKLPTISVVVPEEEEIICAVTSQGRQTHKPKHLFVIEFVLYMKIVLYYSIYYLL